MSVLIVVESHFGNTLTVARNIASGLVEGGVEVTVAQPGEVASVPSDVALLLVGAPTHNLRLPSATSREQAAGRGGGPTGTRSVADWIASVTPRTGLPVRTFDTVVAGAFSGSAAKDAAKRLRRRGFRAERGESFVVTGTKGPLRDGEEARAAQWGVRLAADAR